ncbi:MAG TPA: hypothetical protein VHV82_02945 [Sporichthyaceae bacterium]|nr:hypothetical protein [Sporichthyaceae bacterium]
MAVLVAGTIASQAGAGAAVAAHPATPTSAVTTKDVPVAPQKPLDEQVQQLAEQQHVTVDPKTVDPKAAPAQPVSALARPVSAPGKAGKKADEFDYTNASYLLTLRSAGIEYVDNIPRELQQDQGFSSVDLLHDLGQPVGRCETLGAAYWLGQEVEEGVLGKGAAPPDAGDVSGGYKNPFVSRDVEPNVSTGQNESNRDPGILNYFPPGNTIVPLNADGPGYHWTAKCADDAHGTGHGDTLNVGGVQVVGSSSDGKVDKSTGIYTGTSRAYILGLEGTSGFDSASSFMQITNKPNAPATISYRMSYFNSGDTTGKNGITFGGTDIPVAAFADAFNSGAKSFEAAISAVGPIGARTLEPSVGVSTDGGRYSINIAAFAGHLGFQARKGTIGQFAEARYGSITFQGVYGDQN